MAFRRNKNLRDLIGRKTLLNSKVVRKSDNRSKKGWCSPCNNHGNNLCCKHVRNTNTFQSNTKKRIFKIHHRVNCRSKFIIYLLECNRCKIQYVGKSEWSMNIRINNHRKDVLKEDSISVCRHFNETRCTFKDNAKITIIEMLKQQDKRLTQMRRVLEDREDFWIKTLKTLTPNGFNECLNRI